MHAVLTVLLPAHVVKPRSSLWMVSASCSLHHSRTSESHCKDKVTNHQVSNMHPSTRYGAAGLSKRVCSTIRAYTIPDSVVLYSKHALISHRLNLRLLFNAQLQPKVAETVPVRAKCGLNINQS